MEAKQISLFCLLLAALAGKIETKPSGSLNALSAEQRTFSTEQDIVSQGTSSVSLGSAGSFGTGTGGVGTLHRGYPNGVTALDGLNNGFTGFGLNSIHGQSGFFGQGLESYGNFGQDIIDCQGLGGSGGNCQQRTGRIGIPGDCGCGSYQQNLPLTSLSSFGQQQNLPFTSLGCLGQQQNLPFTSLGCLGQQQYGSLSSCIPCGTAGSQYGSLSSCIPCGTAGSQGGLSSVSLPCTSYNQVGRQGLGYGGIYDSSSGCQSGFESLAPYTAGLSYQQGITASTGCDYCQGITGTTGYDYCQSCQSTPICDNTCDSTCTDAVVVVAVPMEEGCCDCGDGTVVTDPCLTC